MTGFGGSLVRVDGVRLDDRDLALFGMSLASGWMNASGCLAEGVFVYGWWAGYAGGAYKGAVYVELDSVYVYGGWG